ncbi:hypothetical protein PHYBLDRAFT_61687 [Phycomyces blakesleeanus NRRL 1555(-)]|uniref:Uncharacterized protein n=1 Tax=Phycomyces blakesleeanus (strain ATCC 8743b / DSM 1359 / FGSC 10004 / NBRC 33097 / NRRL 1555) TaxID=763407 RepID=A0A162YH49_PHYB8|nr:hypothetical protein PHYBLDRAFT_61687 [Phycomyces blakesleeanus NRRL 1555(-)]OAD80635.1 hypothetical protein PHYBLDRAFT_61687 [Phycomyces blakesleeanus NRRL 1555(-)]|eukprot:XP_018298675.1 hypothetical protein PHYBLDRAFT_61687 [Phycomyces blakesleeanus NRRL 1555(-)]
MAKEGGKAIAGMPYVMMGYWTDCTSGVDHESLVDLNACEIPAKLFVGFQGRRFSKHPCVVADKENPAQDYQNQGKATLVLIEQKFGVCFSCYINTSQHLACDQDSWVELRSNIIQPSVSTITKVDRSLQNQPICLLLNI